MEKVKESFEKFDLPVYREIPDVGLYLDQVVKYINWYFEDFPEMHVTSSMLTNYVKLRIVSRSGKKTYNRHQIAAFIFIAMSKTVLSMHNIRTVLEERGGDEGGELYSEFREKMLNVLGALADEKELPGDRNMISYICMAIGHKMYLDRYFCARDEN